VSGFTEMKDPNAVGSTIKKFYGELLNSRSAIQGHNGKKGQSPGFGQIPGEQLQ